ncbi:MAG: DUF6516 family protein [Desulfobacter sp.]|uniref:toxin-antitoxin system TumE family protein n=1 Tax=uncultured Desulfobacter sp. TaxID=240139 RepID=UPI003749D1FC|nr:DUF6516 family protein [Desulfobacter sp.]
MTTLCGVVIIYNMEAELILKRKYPISINSFVELIIWSLPSPLPGSKHNFKYRFAFVVDNICVLRYDNEVGKGDHKHIGEKEVPYQFKSKENLIEDFLNDVNNWGT